MDTDYLIEFLAVYLYAPVSYPLYAFYYWGSNPVNIIPWLSIGVIGILALRRFFQLLLKPFVAIWFLPSTIICGAAATAPWILVLPYAFYEGGCATPSSLAITLGFNLLLVYGISALWRRISNRRKSVS
ncbi:MAG: hypothetical protein AAF351_08020 [Pseudomonadota bacterium]